MRHFSGTLLFVLLLLFLPLQLQAQGRPPNAPPRLINLPNPDCGAGKSCHGVHGRVRLIIDILADGNIGDVRAELGDSRLVEAATAAVQQAEFQPGRGQGEPKNMDFVLTLNF